MRIKGILLKSQNEKTVVLVITDKYLSRNPAGLGLRQFGFNLRARKFCPNRLGFGIFERFSRFFEIFSTVEDDSLY